MTISYDHEKSLLGVSIIIIFRILELKTFRLISNVFEFSLHGQQLLKAV